MEWSASDVCLGTLRYSYIYQTHAGQQLVRSIMTKTRTDPVVDCDIDFTPRPAMSLVRFMVAHALSHLEDHFWNDLTVFELCHCLYESLRNRKFAVFLRRL
jgi:hypothetical protein